MSYARKIKNIFARALHSIPSQLRRPILCSNCFTDRGLALEASKFGRYSYRKCPHCNSRTGSKLDLSALEDLAQQFFVSGTYTRTEYGGASVLTFSQWHCGTPEVQFPTWLKADASLIKEKLGIGLSVYGPALWRLGEENEPLNALKHAETQHQAAVDVVRRFPHRSLDIGTTFYRLRKGVEWEKISEPSQYDAPPVEHRGEGRLNGPDFPLLYGSQDLQICVHECRVTKADECYLATLRITQPLVLLDLCTDIGGDGRTPFESLTLAIQFIFSAEIHSYEIAQAIAKAARCAGLDGIIYPSYFSSVRGDAIPNIGLFGYPLADGNVELLCINRLLLDTAHYGVSLGPCLDQQALFTE